MPAPTDLCRRRRRPAARRGFTLIEASLTTVIVGTGVLAMMEAQQAYHRKNEIATRSGTGQLLANEMRELMHGLPAHSFAENGTLRVGSDPGELTPADFNDLDDFTSMQGVYEPPIDALGQELVDPEMQRWRQVVTMGGVYSGLIDAVGTEPLDALGPDMVRVQVTAQYDLDPDPAPAARRWVPVADLVWVVPR